MNQVTLSGRSRKVKVTPYLIDWHAKQPSKLQTHVVNFLFSFWKNDIVLVEWPVPGTRMKYDIVNLTKKIVIENDGEQHFNPKSLFHAGSNVKWLAQIKRDLEKDKIAEKNGFKMIRIRPKDLPLSKEWFQEKHNINL